MKFSSKLTLAIAVTSVASIVFPIAAYAGPSTGSTAAAVSIKFNDCNCGPTSGNFSINPGGNANGTGTGIKELSAAVATGETRAKANSAAPSSGTHANAEGYSKPVSFTYNTYSDVSNKTYKSEYDYDSEYKQQAAIEFAASAKKTQSLVTSDSEQVELLKKGYYDRNGKYIKYSSSDVETYNSASYKEGSLRLNASGEASAVVSDSGKTYKTYGSTETGTSYHYTGSSAGLSYIPIIK